MKFDSSVPRAPQFVSKAPVENMPPFKKATKKTPDRTINAALPLWLALGTGFVSFIAIGLIAIGYEWPVRVPLIVSGAITLFTLVLWSFLLIKTDLLWSIEEITGLDITKDGFVGSPQAQPEIRIQIAQEGKPNILTYLHLPATDDQYQSFLRGWLVGTSLAEDNWCGTGKEFSKKDFHKLRDYLLTHGLIIWRDPDHPSQSLAFTAFGKKVMWRLVEEEGLLQLPAAEYAGTHAHARVANAPPQLESGEVGGDDDAE